MKGIKLVKMALVLAALAAATLAITGCAQDASSDSVNASERMDMFCDDVNAQKFGNLTKHLHSDVGGAPDAEFWKTYFEGVTDLTPTTSGKTATATSKASGFAFAFTLAEDETDVYKITDITKNGASILTDY
jgi:hypothetical protein